MRETGGGRGGDLVDEEMVVLQIGTINFPKRMLNVNSTPPSRIEYSTERGVENTDIDISEPKSRIN